MEELLLLFDFLLHELSLLLFSALVSRLSSTYAKCNPLANAETPHEFSAGFSC